LRSCPPTAVNYEREPPSTDPPAPPMRIGPPRWKLAILVWLAIFPALTLLLWLIGPEIRDWPLALRTLALTAVLVPVMVFVLLPALQRLLAGWLRS
jgi:antibiotic biosynthesis monooxygenase (ABM) superfamily enzyme